MNDYLPSFITPGSPYHPDTDELKMWAKDAVGNNILIGLNLLETEEYLALINKSVMQSAEKERHLQLYNIHEQARLKRLACDIDTRSFQPTFEMTERSFNN